MTEKIIILDCGSQVTMLIGRRLREAGIYCEIVPYNKIPAISDDIKGFIISGSPCSVLEENSPSINLGAIEASRPVLGICYGAQFISKYYGGSVEHSQSREYGRAQFKIHSQDEPLFEGISKESTVWMSHGDSITSLPSGCTLLGSTEDVRNAAFRLDGRQFYGLQFHPEVYHSEEGSKMLSNFCYKICGCSGGWTAESFIQSSVAALKEQIGEGKVILGLSGGVDSTVAAVLLDKAIGKRLTCIFVDNGLLRKNEFEKVMASYKDMGLNVIGADASEDFLSALAGVTDPEAKRKAIGRVFVETFEKYAAKVDGAQFLAQGTIYPDVIESAGVAGVAQKIKSHHNVGGLPERMHLKIVEPLRTLFKDEVRRVGRSLGISEELIGRHPFPGPSLAIRVIGEVSREKLDILREADDIFIRSLKEAPGAGFPSASDPRQQAKTLYDAIWQAGVILLPVQSVGVMGDERTYESAVALRAVVSTDAMTADWFRFPYDFLASVSNEIIRKVKGINRVVYDISSKPPATIEWE